MATSDGSADAVQIEMMLALVADWRRIISMIDKQLAQLKPIGRHSVYGPHDTDLTEETVARLRAARETHVKLIEQFDPATPRSA